MQATPQARRLLRLSEVAEALGVSRGRVRELVADGQLRSVRFGEHGWHRVPVEEVERILSAEEKAQ